MHLRKKTHAQLLQLHQKNREVCGESAGKTSWCVRVYNWVSVTCNEIRSRFDFQFPNFLHKRVFENFFKHFGTQTTLLLSISVYTLVCLDLNTFMLS